MDNMVEIKSKDYWFKVVDFLQQNWALVDQNKDATVTIFFISDTSGVFDQMTFPSMDDAHKALRINGFERLSEDKEAQKFLRIPRPPFRNMEHPNGKIYSSGRYWES